MSNNIVSATITTNFPSPQENKLKNTLILNIVLNKIEKKEKGSSH